MNDATFIRIWHIDVYIYTDLVNLSEALMRFPAHRSRAFPLDVDNDIADRCERPHTVKVLTTNASQLTEMKAKFPRPTRTGAPLADILVHHLDIHMA